MTIQSQEKPKLTLNLQAANKPKLNLQKLTQNLNTQNPSLKPPIPSLKLNTDKLNSILGNKQPVQMKPSTYTNEAVPPIDEKESVINSRLDIQPTLKLQPEAQINQKIKSPKQLAQKQEFWLDLRLGSAFVPNHNIDYSQQNPQAIVRATLLQRNETSFWPLKKANPEVLSTIAHEQRTDLTAQTTSRLETVLSMVTQPQKIYANTATNLFDFAAFKMGNSAIIKFCNEKIIFNDKLENVQENAFLLLELIQIPTWRNGAEQILGFSCVKFSEIPDLQNQDVELSLFATPKGKGLGKYEPLLNKMYSRRVNINVEALYENLDQQTNQLKTLEKEVKNCFVPEEIGFIDFKFKFLSEDQIIQERNVRKTAIYPYDVEQNGPNIQKDGNKELETQQNVDLTKYDEKVREQMNILHKVSLQTATNPTKFDQKFHCSSFTSASISMVASSPVGNTALGAAAILSENDTYNIILFNIVSGQQLCLVGSHYGYVYQLKFSADGRFLFSCSADGTILVFDVRQFTYFGFNYYFDKKQDEINKVMTIIQAKKKSDLKLDEKDETIFKDFEKFIRDEVSKKQQLYQFGDIEQDLDCLQQLTTIAGQVVDLNKISTQINSELINELQQKYLKYTISDGTCIYDCQQINPLTKDYLNIKQIGLLHDLTIKRPFIPINLQLISGNLTGNLKHHHFTQAEQNKKAKIITEDILLHSDYINSVKIFQNKIFSGDASGIIKLTIFSQVNDVFQFKFNQEIITQPDLKDFMIMRQKQADKSIALILTLSAFNQLNFYDSSGKFLASLNDELSKKTSLECNIQTQKFIGNCRMSQNLDKTIGYVQFYGGVVCAITCSYNIYQANYLLNEFQPGLFVSALHYSQHGLLASFNQLGGDMKQVLAGFVPSGAVKYEELPIIIQGCNCRVVQRKFDHGEIINTVGDNQIIDKTKEQSIADEIQDTEFEQINENTDLKKQVDNFLLFIKESRQRMKE